MKQKTRTTLFTAILLIAATCIQAKDYTGKCGTNLNWTYNSNTGALAITGHGAMTDYTAASPATWNQYRSAITSVSLPDNITTIGAYAFNGFTALREITIPENVTTINDYAFNGCTALDSIFLNSNLTIGTGSIPQRSYRTLTISDESGLNFNLAANTYNIIKYQRTLEEGQLGTIILPFELNEESKRAFNFYKISSSTDNTLRFSQVEDPQPNTPYIYENASEEISNELISINNATILNGDIEYMVTDDEKWTMTGIYTTLDVTLDAYLEITYALVDGEIQNSSKSVQISPFRCYFLGPKFDELFPDGKSSYSIALNRNDFGTTAIDKVPNDEIEKQASHLVYNLQGKVTTISGRGIYIINGKKVLVK